MPIKLMANATMAMMSCLRVLVAVLAARAGSAARSVDSAPGGVAAAIRGPADHRHPGHRVGAEAQRPAVAAAAHKVR